MYAVVYGFNGMAGAILAVATSYHKAQQIALREYNDSICAENVTWAEMCSSYAENDQYILTVQLP